MACNDCPELNPNPNEGCLQPINSSCVTYDGNDINCAEITSGQTISQVIETLANNDCNLQDQIDDLKDDLQELSGVVQVIDNKIEELSGSQYSFSCSELSACSLDSLSNVDVEPLSGQSLIYNGTKWVNYTPEQKYQFSCQELSGCNIDSLGNVIESTPVSGQCLIYNGTNWVNSNIETGKTYSVQNGLTESPTDVFKLGGTLLENTSFNGNYDFYFGNRNYIFGDDSSLINSTGLKFAHKLTKALGNLTGGFSTNYKHSTFTINSDFNLPGGQALFNDNNLTTLYVNNSKAIPFSSKMAGQTSYFQFRGEGIHTLTMSNKDDGSALGILANHMSVLMLDNLTNDAANIATVSRFANYASVIVSKNINQNKITDFCHVFLADITNNLANPSYVTNSWGIYQEGIVEKNYFAGEIFMLPNLPVYADNAAATSGGLPKGALYRTSTGDLKVRY